MSGRMIESMRDLLRWGPAYLQSCQAERDSQKEQVWGAVEAACGRNDTWSPFGQDRSNMNHRERRDLFASSQLGGYAPDEIVDRPNALQPLPGDSLQKLQHGPLALLGRDSAQDRADRKDCSSLLPDDLAEISFADPEFKDGCHLAGDFLDLHLFGSVHEALGEVLDKFLHFASRHGSNSVGPGAIA